MDTKNIDPEKQVHVSGGEDYSSVSSDTENAAIDYGTGFAGMINKFSAGLNAETRGIERIPEDERADESLWNAASMWFGSNMVIATYALGVLGVTLFGLDFWSAFLVIIFFNLLGSLAPAFFSTFGPHLGLRQMILSRYWFGYFGVRVCAFFNILACIGWTAVNTIVSAQMLHTVNNGKLPPWAGVLIITLLTIVVTFFGYRVVHTFEKYIWIPNIIVFLIIAIQMGRSHTFTYGSMGSGATEAGNVLSFGATVYGFATGWTSYAADYTVYMRPNKSRPQIFFSVLAGLNTPLNICMILGAACAMGTTTRADWLTKYNDDGIGGLLYAILVTDSLHGFGQFCMVIVGLSTISNNIPNLYSLGLSAQALWSVFQKVPRVAWTVIGGLVSLAIAIPAYMYFEQVMDNFMNLIGYWLAIYSAIALSEHFIYIGGLSKYDVSIYDQPRKLPMGLSALFAFACGIAGAVIGMSQAWWVGPVAKKIGEYYGDVGFELSFSFAFVTFNVCRPFERKYFGR